MRPLPRHLALLLPFGLSACISLPFSQEGDRPAPAMYTLYGPRAETMDISTEASGRVVVVVPTPELPPGFDTERIALQFEQDGRLDYYADAQWSSRLDLLIQDVLIDRAQQALPGTIVGKPDLVPAPHYRLAVKITEFAPVYKASADISPRLDAGLSMTVIALPQDMVIAQFTVRKSAPAAENRLTAVTSGLKDLLHSVVDDALAKAAPHIRETPNVVQAE